VEIELPDDADEEFYVEDNSCPGTGLVGIAVRELVEAQIHSVSCLFCAANGKNKIVHTEQCACHTT
jgi:hypothetical protein